MKILIDLRLLLKGQTSGIEEYTRLLTTNLLESDSTNEYVFFYNGFRKKSLPEPWLKKKNVSLVDWHFPNRLLDLSFRWLNWPKVDAFVKPDLIFSPHFNLLGLTKSAKRIMAFHDLSVVHFPEFYPWRKRYWHWSQNYRSQAKKATALTTISEFTKNDLIENLGIAPEKIRVIYPGLDDFYRPIEAGDKQLIDFAERCDLLRPFLLSVSVLEPRKNIPALVKAFELVKSKKENRDLKLVIVGKKGWFYEPIFREIDVSPHKDQIVLWGEASREDLRRLYNLASIFVYPSFFEGFGFPPLEAQACGAPVVASNRSSLPEILGGSALLIDPLRIEELSLAIETVLNDGKVKDSLKEKGFMNARRFNWPKAAGTMLRLFQEINDHA